MSRTRLFHGWILTNLKEEYQSFSKFSKNRSRENTSNFILWDQYHIDTEAIQKYVWNLSSVQFSSSVMSDSLWPHGLQHTRLPCPSPTPEAWSNSCPSSRWCHPIISSSVSPFSWLQSFPASGSFSASPFFASGGQSTGVSASTSVLLMNILDWFPLELTGWIALLSKGLSRVFSNTTVQKHQFFCAQLPLWSNSYIHTWLLEKQ